MNIVIEQGRVLCPVDNVDIVMDLYIQDGKVVSLGEPHESFTPDTIIKAKNCMVMPGLVDGYGYHKNQDGNIYHDVLEKAPEYGFTTLFCSPKNLTTDNPSRAKKISESIQPIDIIPIGALTESLEGKQIADLTALKHAGCQAFSQDLFPIHDLSMVRHCYQYAASFDLTVIIFPMEPSLSTGHIHEGQVSAITGLKGIAESAETIAVASHLHLIEETGVRAHFSHITCGKSLELIEQAKQQGLHVTAGCTMHHLHLSEMDVVDLNPNAYVIPPLRSLRSQTMLRQGLERGILNSICSSHQPLPRLVKQAPFAESSPGLSSLSLMLSLGLHLVREGHLSLMTWLKSVSCGPLEAYGLKAKPIAKGATADLCIVDPNTFWTVTEQSFADNACNSPFLNWELPGKVLHTIKNGELIYTA